MLLLLLVFGVAFWIVVGAIRIIMGWVLPREMMAAFDRAVGRAVKLLFQLCVVAAAAGIVYLVWAAARSP